MTIILIAFGLVMVFSASFVEGFTNPDILDSSFIFRHQLVLVAIGLVALVAATLVPYWIWNTWGSWVPWALVVILLIAVLVVGNEELGGQRWIDIFGFSVQPSELAKPALVLIVAMLVLNLREVVSTPFIWQIAAAVGLPVVLILIQPDLGTTIIILVGLLAVLYFAEVRVAPLLLGAGLVAIIGLAFIRFVDFRSDRIDAWLDPEGHASEAGYQIMNSLYAFAGGGPKGVGLGMSHQKYLYLPQPHNDLIFPIIGEEFGLVGTVAVIVFFLLFLYAAYHIARTAPDMYGRIVAGSAGTIIGFQAFLNMLCTVNLLPITGKPLPFFSAGGNSIIVTLILVGLILSVSFRSNVPDAAVQKRDEFRIYDGGQRPAQTRKHPAPAQPLRKQQPATARSKPNQQLRRPPAPAQTSTARSSSSQQLRRPSAPSTSSAPSPASVSRPNPVLKLSPARYQASQSPARNQRSTGTNASAKGTRR
jgi:cell division protein FtsW